MRRTILVFLVFKCFTLAAQNNPAFEKTNVLLGRADGATIPNILFGSSVENAYVQVHTGIGKKTLYEAAPGATKSHQYKILKIEGQKRFPIKGFVHNNKLYMLYFHNNKKAKRMTLYAHEINKQTMEPDLTGKKLFEYTYLNLSEEYSIAYNIQINVTQAKPVIWFATPSSDGHYVLHLNFFSSSFALERSPIYEVQSPNVEFRQEIVSPGGSMYFLFQERFGDKGEQTPVFKILQFTTSGIKMEKFGLPYQDLIDARLVLDTQGELNVAGYCLGDGDADISNVFKAQFDTSSLELHHVKISPLNISAHSDPKTNNQMGFYIKEILFDKAGNMFIAGEEYKQDVWVSYAPVTNSFNIGNLAISKTTMEETGKTYYSHYGNILITVIPYDKYEALTIRIAKNQDVVNDVSYASFIIKPTGLNAVSVFFNAVSGTQFSLPDQELTRRERSGIIFKVVTVDSNCKKTEALYLHGMGLTDKNGFNKEYRNNEYFNIPAACVMADGSALLITKDPFNSKAVYVWK